MVSRYDDDFEAALAFTIPHEGTVFENDPQDPGGATKLGVTLIELRSYHHDQSLTAQDVANLVLADVEPIYYDDYWTKMRCGDMPKGVNLVVFDYGVNAGPKRSIEFLQDALGVDVDGEIGDQTLTALRDCNDIVGLITKLTDEESDYYKALPTFPRFGRGWLNRVNDRRVSALAEVT